MNRPIDPPESGADPEKQKRIRASRRRRALSRKETAALVAEAKAALHDELRVEMEKLFEREKNALLERAQLLLSTAKWTGAALAVLLGLLGIKAWSDIKSNVEGHFEAKLNETYRLDDPASPIARSLDQLIDRAVVNALYVQALKNRQQSSLDNFRRPWDRTTDITPAELDRVLGVLKSEKTENNLFQDALITLSALAVVEETRTAVAAPLADLVAAKSDSESQWMAANERKRVLILSSFHSAEAIDSEAAALLSQPLSERLKLAALNRIRRENYRAGLPAVLSFIEKTDDQQVKQDGLLTLARLQADHAVLKEHINQKLLQDSDKRAYLRAIELAAIIMKNGDRIGPNDEEDQRRDLALAQIAQPLVARAIEGGAYITIGDRFERSIAAKIQTGPNSYRSIPIDRAIYSEPLIHLLLDAAARKGVSTLALYVNALTDQSGRVAIEGSLQSNSGIALATGATLTATQNIKTVNFKALSSKAARSNPTTSAQRHLDVIWTDETGRSQREPIRSIQDVLFSAKVNWSGIADEKEEIY